jgi:threonine synthase
MAQEETAVQTERPVSPIVDGAVSPVDLGTLETSEDRLIASDTSRDLEERLEAFEAVYESEIGDTNLTRARNFEREFGLRQLYLKFEGSNATGTQKDRISFAQAMDALRRGFDVITAASCGNYGVALAFAAKCAGLRCVVYVPETYRPTRLGEIESLGATIVREGNDYEGSVVASKARAARDELYDANPGGANTILQLAAYQQIAYEIYDDLRDAPAVVAVPVSNGTTFAGIWKGFVSLHRRGKISRLPHMVAGSSFGKNPIVQSSILGLAECADLDPSKVRESRVNEPLINWHSTDGDWALHAIRESKGWAAYATDKAMRSYARLIREREGLMVMPASTAGLVALIEGRKEPFPADRYVAVLTGRRS